eukprot:79080_1
MPTANPIATTTPRPTDPVGTWTCGDTTSGAYHGQPVTFVVNLPYDGSLQFNAAGSSFVVTDIEAFTNLNVALATDADNDEEVTLYDKPAGDYKFIINGEGTSSGTFKATIACLSADPTAHPLTPAPTPGSSASPITSAPTHTAILPTASPVKIEITSAPDISEATTDSDSESEERVTKHDTMNIGTVATLVIGPFLIVCCVCG